MDEKKSGAGLSINTGGGEISGDIVSGDQHKGDNVEGHKGNVVDNTNATIGEQTNNQTFGESGADPAAAVLDVLKVVIAMGAPVAELAATLENEASAPNVSSDAAEAIAEVAADKEFNPLDFAVDNEKPEALAAEFQSYSAMPPHQFEELPPEEKESFSSRMVSTVTAAAKAGKPGFIKCLKIAATLCSAATPTGVVGLVGIGLNGVVEQFGD